VYCEPWSMCSLSFLFVDLPCLWIQQS
jgi:hypothetical protein